MSQEKKRVNTPNLDLELSAIVAGDTRAFARWVAGAELPLRAELRRFATVVDVEAVLQETLLRTWQVAPRFKPDPEPNALLRLSCRIAKNLAIDHARRDRRKSDDESAIQNASVTPVAPDPLLRRRLLECEEKLPKKLGAALRARLASRGAEPDAVLARRLKMRLNTFLQNVTRARRLLAQCLRRGGVDLERELA
jgi:DNA-directed RNA polymerase specialized sigma24 family protein